MDSSSGDSPVALSDLQRAPTSERGGGVASGEHRPRLLIAKRLEDLLFLAIILPLICVPFLLIAFGIKVSSPGPIVFRQRRIGLNGGEFLFFKFRTMSVSEDGAHVRQATRSDPRVTRFGAFLRLTHLDELPQFFNVLWGDMSIVGPRPMSAAHRHVYRPRIPSFDARTHMKPGITGWAQINGWRGDVDTFENVERRIEHDLWYISNWGIWLDLKIMFLTLFAAQSRKNAY
jgi:putative colanic acid biosysnthesis UDP-glucose lipid carrier transferase